MAGRPAPVADRGRGLGAVAAEGRPLKPAADRRPPEAGGRRSGLPGPVAGQFGRFLLVGCSNFLVSFAVFYLFYRRWPLSEALLGDLERGGSAASELLRALGVGSLNAALANVLGYSAGVANSFVWNRYWTFKARDRAARQLRRFVLLNLASLALSSVSLFAFTDALGWSYKVVWPATMAVVTGLNFALAKTWVFKS